MLLARCGGRGGVRAEISASHRGGGTKRQEGAEGSEDKICAPGNRRAWRPVWSAVGGIGGTVSAGVPQSRGRSESLDPNAPLGDQSGSLAGSPYSLGHIWPAVTRSAGIESCRQTRRSQAGPTDGLTAFAACFLRLEWLGSYCAGRLAQEYLQKLRGAYKRCWPVRFAHAIPIYGCSHVLFTGALLRTLQWLPPAPGTSWGCVTEGYVIDGAAALFHCTRRVLVKAGRVQRERKRLSRHKLHASLCNGVCVIFNKTPCRGSLHVSPLFSWAPVLVVWGLMYRSGRC